MGLDVELRVNSPALLILGVLKTHVNFLQRTNRREKKKRGGAIKSKEIRQRESEEETAM